MPVQRQLIVTVSADMSCVGGQERTDSNPEEVSKRVIVANDIKTYLRTTVINEKCSKHKIEPFATSSY